ncbi:MAG: hypothetical protein JW384_00856 [Nitrosomonadaceae bacterium]|nr:hypothetical protein [Nitrosomonadaceae bacterium]
MIMALYGSTNTRAGSGDRNASGGCRRWGQGSELKFLKSVKI